MQRKEPEKNPKRPKDFRGGVRMTGIHNEEFNMRQLIPPLTEMGLSYGHGEYFQNFGGYGHIHPVHPGHLNVQRMQGNVNPQTNRNRSIGPVHRNDSTGAIPKGSYGARSSSAGAMDVKNNSTYVKNPFAIHGNNTTAMHGNKAGPMHGNNTAKHRNNAEPKTSNYNKNVDDPSGIPKKRFNFRLGFKKLEEMIDEDPETLVVKLANEKLGFSDLLNGNLTPDYIVLIISVVSKMCQSSFASNKATIMGMICKEHFMTQLQTFVLMLPIHTAEEKRRSQYYWRNEASFWQNLFVSCETIVNTIPSVAVDKLPKLLQAINYSIESLEISEGVKLDFVNLKSKLLHRKEEMEMKHKSTKDIKEDDLEPPDDFRKISLYPSAVEITNPKRAFLRENKVEGSYKDVNHYLDVQFRLLREDFVAPLRQGICDFLDKSRNARIQNIKIHPKVQFLGPEVLNGSRGEVLQFRPDKKKIKMKYENSRKFMFGSLVCFTKNNFVTLIFGKIIDRKKERLEIGQLIIGIEPSSPNVEYYVDYVMVECNVYFEPYYQVLSALQTMDEEKFPMKRYLVDVARDNKLPDYIEGNRLEIGQYIVDIDTDTWPSAANLQLNDTQYEAYKAALTQQFTIVQGPPGTGKTYLGLRIAKTLLRNSDIWYKKTPMLIVCYTNHALDQFLEGLCDTTKKIVRFGGQSKNVTLSQYNIRQIRMKRDVGVNQLLWQKRRELQDKIHELNMRYNELNAIYDYAGVIDVTHFVNFIPELKHSWFTQTKPELIKNWFLGGRIPDVKIPERIPHMQSITAENESSDESDGEEMFDAIDQHIHEEVDDFNLPLVQNVRYIFKLTDMEGRINAIQAQLELLDPFQGARLQNEQMQLIDNLRYLKIRMDEGRRIPQQNRPDENVDLQSPQNIHPDLRWRLYFYWLNMYERSLKEIISKTEKEYLTCNLEYQEVRDIEDIQIMRNHLVVGMTTTGAARLHTSLQALKSPIVIVEEAAEIMEPHVITSLTNHCQHLILIGDHQQLRPSTADYRVEKKYLLGISLFERMVKNKMHCNVLGVQHRMRPEFAKLIVPAIYQNLQNHSSVHNFPPIKGIDSCLYFITHEHLEETCGDSSKSNLHEATYLLQLAKYLLLNGYKPEDITIVAAYSGQMFSLWRQRKAIEILKDVRITVLDNYQGEECKIILLSLVRNNMEKKIGFLSLENRVCVALSRAKEGFYIMGNIDLLCSSSQIWPQIRKALEEQNALGTSLDLRCQIHPDTVTSVQTADDFYKVSEGGCSKLCGLALNCGHDCKMQCHTYNRDHTEYKCRENCTNILCENNHVCPKLCYEVCGKCNVPVSKKFNCGHTQFIPCHKNPNEVKCTVMVPTELPCNHLVDKPCHEDSDTYRCPFPCDTRIDKCGHACRLNCHIRKDPDHLLYECHKPCAKYRVGCNEQNEKHLCPNTCSAQCSPCDIIVKKERTCSHFYQIQCYIDVDEILCEKPCKKQLPCGHLCKKKCNETCGNCKVKVDKILPDCGHKVKAECSQEPTRKLCKGRCPRLLSCGHVCQKKCNEICTTICTALIKNPFKTACGHVFDIPCHLQTENLAPNSQKLLKHCFEPCAHTLECGHKCSGNCGSCNQGRIHKTCFENCGVVLVCGHVCKTPCRETCQPCQERCTYKCKHSICKKKCGEPCTPCTEPCKRKCEHVQCTSKCGDVCNVPPCDEPCSRILPCGHGCIGFCGDTCPRLCLVCDNKILTEDFVLGYEDEEDARFVLIEECGHVIESRGMENWLKIGDNAINVKRCPQCNTPLAFTHRYSNYIKQSINDITTVKQKFYGTPNANERMRTGLLRKLQDEALYTKISMYSEESKKMKNFLITSLQPVKNTRRQPFHNMLAKTLTSTLQIFQQICELVGDQKRAIKNPKCIAYIDFLLKTLRKCELRITNQEINDFTRETRRLQRILQLVQIEDHTNIASLTVDSTATNLYESLKTILYGIQPYDMNNDIKIKTDLEKLCKLTSAPLDINSKEFQEIIKAVGVKLGAWYKCPNGHVYAIGDCGGATQVGRCADCNAQIGGTSHNLLSSNTHADVDGSRHAAWSEGANMINYRF